MVEVMRQVASEDSRVRGLAGKDDVDGCCWYEVSSDSDIAYVVRSPSRW